MIGDFFIILKIKMNDFHGEERKRNNKNLRNNTLEIFYTRIYMADNKI